MPKLAETTRCTGCTACISKCPKRCLKMETDENGFYFPFFMENAGCVECGLCENVCPVLNKKNIVEQGTVAYAAYSVDPEIRKESSSGGIFSEFAIQILNENGAVYGAVYGKNFSVYHMCITEIAELWRIRGAKYAQSNLGKTFNEIKIRLEKEQKVLFSGTPCQIAGLKMFLERDFENLICIDFVCHGVPAPLAWKKYVEYRAMEDNNGILPQKINMRSKCSGWSFYRYSNEYEYDNGKKYIALGDEDLYMKLFVGNYISRECCSRCQFKGYKRVSDVTIGDFWGIWDVCTEMDDNMGTSLILVHSRKGSDWLECISERIVRKQVTLEMTSNENPSMLVASQEHLERAKTLEIIREGQISSLQNYFLKEKNKGSILKQMKQRAIKMVYQLMSKT